MSLLVQVRAKHFVAGLVLEQNTCVEAAPIIKYMVGWTRERIREYCRNKGWKAVIVGE